MFYRLSRRPTQRWKKDILAETAIESKTGAQVGQKKKKKTTIVINLTRTPQEKGCG